MNQANSIDGVVGQTSLPPETTQPSNKGEGTPPPLAQPPATAAGDVSKLVAKRIKTARKEFEDQVGEMIEVARRDLCLRLLVTMSFIWLKIGDQVSYVDAILETLQGKYKDRWTPAKKTLQHYEGPILRWLAVLAKKKNPADPNLREKFSPTFLRTHPEYILGREHDLEDLLKECQTLEVLDEKYGHGRLKAGKNQSAIAPGKTAQSRSVASLRTHAIAEAKEAEVQPSVIHPLTEVRTEKNQAKPAGAKPRRTALAKRWAQSLTKSDSMAWEPPAPPTNDELLEKIDAVKLAIKEMKAAGVPVDSDARRAIMDLCMIAVNDGRYYGRQEAMAA